MDVSDTYSKDFKCTGVWVWNVPSLPKSTAGHVITVLCQQYMRALVDTSMPSGFLRKCTC